MINCELFLLTYSLLQTCQVLNVQNLETFIFFSKKPGDSVQNREIFVFDKFFSKNTKTLTKSDLFSCKFLIRHRPPSTISIETKIVGIKT